LLHNEIDSAHNDGENRNPNNTKYVENLIYLVDSGRVDEMEAQEIDGLEKLRKEKLFFGENNNGKIDEMSELEKHAILNSPKRTDTLSKEALAFIKESSKKKKPEKKKLKKKNKDLPKIPGWKSRALIRKKKTFLKEQKKYIENKEIINTEIIPTCELCYWKTKHDTCEAKASCPITDVFEENCTQFIAIKEAFKQGSFKKIY